MTDKYENLDELDLFEERDSTEYEVPDYFAARVEDVDEIFADTDVKPTVYPAEETLYSLHIKGDVPKEEDIILALVGEFAKYVRELEPGDFEQYEGQYLMPEDVDNTVLKIDVSETNSLPVDVDFENIEFEVPVDQPPIP
jgi:hypothetical protein